MALTRKMATWLRTKLEEAARGGRGKVVLSLAGHAELRTLRFILGRVRESLEGVGHGETSSDLLQKEH